MSQSWTTHDDGDTLETIFPKGHQFHDRIFYDRREGSYYDRHTDIFITLDEARAFGVR